MIVMNEKRQFFSDPATYIYIYTHTHTQINKTIVYNKVFFSKEV